MEELRDVKKLLKELLERGNKMDKRVTRLERLMTSGGTTSRVSHSRRTWKGDVPKQVRVSDKLTHLHESNKAIQSYTISIPSQLLNGCVVCNCL